MDKQLITELNNKFEGASYEQDGVEYWMARDIQVLLGYTEWRNFAQVIEKAKMACFNSHQPIGHHFVEVNKTIAMPKGASRDIDDIMLTRYACYLIAQNGDPKKGPIAFAQSYFAIQTRKQELLEARIALTERLIARKKLTETEMDLSGTIYQHGVDDQGFGRIRSKGDQALFGGNTTLDMKKRLGVPQSSPLADFLPTITIKAKDFATEITNFNTKDKNLSGEELITREHVKNNQDVRNLLRKSGIVPETLPPEEDIKKLERRLKSTEKQVLKDTKRLGKKNPTKKEVI